MSKRLLLGLLVCANVALLTLLALRLAEPKPAYAQAAGLSSNYLTIAAQSSSNTDSYYVLDVQKRQLYIYGFERGSRGGMVLAGVRDLEADFRGSD